MTGIEIQISQIENDLEELKKKVSKKQNKGGERTGLGFSERFNQLVERNHHIAVRITSELIPISFGMVEAVSRYSSVLCEKEGVDTNNKLQLEEFVSNASTLGQRFSDTMGNGMDQRDVSLDQLRDEYQENCFVISTLEKLYGYLSEIKHLESEAKKSSQSNLRARRQRNSLAEQEAKLNALRLRTELAIEAAFSEPRRTDSSEPRPRLWRRRRSSRPSAAADEKTDDANLVLNIITILLFVFLSFGFYSIFKYYFGYSKTK